jgi:hypothetical protein
VNSELSSDFGALSQTFWHQQRLLELLLYRIEIQHLVLATGRSRWAEHAAREVEETLELVREEELLRATQVAAIGAGLGVDPDLSLRELVEASPEPWNEIFRDHQRAFVELVDEIEASSKANRDLLRRSLDLTREMLGMSAEDDTALGYGPPATYGTPSSPAPRGGSLLVDRSI